MRRLFKQIGWVSRAGEKIGDDFVCPREGRQYRVNENGHLKEVLKYDKRLKETA